VGRLSKSWRICFYLRGTPLLLSFSPSFPGRPRFSIPRRLPFTEISRTLLDMTLLSFSPPRRMGYLSLLPLFPLRSPSHPFSTVNSGSPFPRGLSPLLPFYVIRSLLKLENLSWGARCFPSLPFFLLAEVGSFQGFFVFFLKRVQPGLDPHLLFSFSNRFCFSRAMAPFSFIRNSALPFLFLGKRTVSYLTRGFFSFDSPLLGDHPIFSFSVPLPHN